MTVKKIPTNHIQQDRSEKSIMQQPITYKTDLIKTFLILKTLNFAGQKNRGLISFFCNLDNGWQPTIVRLVGVDGHEDDDEFEGREIPSRSDPAAIVGGTSLTGLSFSLQPRGGVTEDTDRLKNIR